MYIISTNKNAERFAADNWNKLKNLASKVIGEKMKVTINYIYCMFSIYGWEWINMYFVCKNTMKL